MKKILLAILTLLSISAFSQSKKPITHESLWLMKRVNAPAVSPDGKLVVFSVSEPAYDEKEQVSDLWIVPTDGSEKPRRLTFGKSSESGYSWSPDGKYLAFSAKREGDETGQIYILNIADGGEAQRFTTLSTGGRNPVWSPDGKKILFLSSVFPGALTDSANKKIAKDRKDLKYKARVYTTYPIRNWDSWNEDKQTHLFVQSVEQNSTAKDLFAGTKFVSGIGFNADNTSFAWSPIGNQIVFSATENFTDAAFGDVITNLYKISSVGGEPEKLTTDNNQYGSPKFSADGKWLYFQTNKSIPNSGFEYTSTRLGRASWPSFTAQTILTESFDRSLDDFDFSSDGKTIYLTVEDQGLGKIFTVPNEGGSVKELFEMTTGAYSSLSVSAKNNVIVAGYESAIQPLEIVKIPSIGKPHQQLSFFNTEKLSSLDLAPLKSFWFTASNGKKIHSFLVLPPNFDETKKYPLFVLMHGGPHLGYKDNFSYRWNYHLLAQPGYVLVLTNYTGSTGYGEKFAQDIQGDPFATPGMEINEAADAAIKQFKFIDEKLLAAGGASYGGHLANWLQATSTRYKCLISHAGLVNSESQWGTSDAIYHREIGNLGPVWEQNEIWKKQNPIRYAANFKTPMLITVGENDFRVPLNNSLENWAIHQRLKIPSKLIVFPEENHWILKAENSKFFYSEVHNWLKTYLK